MKHSSYHNKLQSWISKGHLLKHEVTTRKMNNTYNAKTKLYEGPQEEIEVLVLHFDFGKSFPIRQPYIKEYLDFIAQQESKTISA